MGIKKPKTVGTKDVFDVYARLSYAEDGETVNVDEQVDMGCEQIERRGGVVGQCFRDNSLSAWNPKVVRPEWNVLMGRLESGASNGVWVLDLTRFSRKMMEGERLLELAAKGVRVLAHAGEYDLTTADGRRHFRESMVAAAAESDKISERVKRGKVRRAKKGRPHGGMRPFGMPGLAGKPAGWEPGDPREMVPDAVVAAEQAIVRECYDRIFAGEGISTLVKELKARGVLGGYGGELTRRTLARMLRREALAGLIIHNGEMFGQLVGVTPVVSREEWERMCGLLDARKTGRPPGAKHFLSGTMRCALCGGPLTGNPRPTMAPYPDGSMRREYRCVKQADRAGCGGVHIDARTAEQAVDEAMRTRLGDPRRAAKMAAHLNKMTEQRAKIEAEIDRLQDSANELATKTAAWGVDRVDIAMQPLLTRIEALQTRLAGLDAPVHADAAAADAVAAWDDARDRGDLVAMRSLVKRAFPTLTVIAARHFNDHSPARIVWDNPNPPARPGKRRPLVRHR